MSIFSHRLRSFLSTSLFFWLIGAILLFMWGYEGSFLKLNAVRFHFLDILMPHYTHLGDGLLACVLVGLFFARKDPSLILSLIIGLCLMGMGIYISKHYLFSDWNRPPFVFHNRVEIYQISLRRLYHFSFPSGHSATAGTAACFLAYYWGYRSPKWWPGTFIALISLGIAYSRVYIGVHFLGDILVGHMIGVLAAIVVLLWIYPSIKGRISRFSHEKVHNWGKWNQIIFGIVLLISTFWLYINEYT